MGTLIDLDRHLNIVGRGAKLDHGLERFAANPLEILGLRIGDHAFDDITALSRECRFDDCAHNAEPGCAVIEAVAGGRLDEDRLAQYQRLLREVAFEARKRDKAGAADVKRRWKQSTKAVRAMYKDRDRR